MKLQNSSKIYVCAMFDHNKCTIIIYIYRSLVDQKKNVCPTNGCYGQGNVQNENFEGRHTTLQSCPMAFIQNQNRDIVNDLRTEILVLKTQLNIDMPRYVDQINSLKTLNNEFKLKIDQLNSTIDNQNTEIDR